MNDLQLFLLGVPQVRLMGRPLHLRTRKILALLVYLATEAGLHPRDKLAELLWPGSTVSARNALRVALHHLQAALGSGTFLRVEQGGIELPRSKRVWVDVLTLQAQAQDHGRPPDPGSAELWRGPFLEGLNIVGAPGWDDWLTVQAQQVALHYDTLLARLAHAQLEQGQLWDGVATARLRVSHNPLNEDAYRQLIQGQLAAGQKAEAQETQRLCRELLHRELGIEPLFEFPELPAPDWPRPALPDVLGRGQLFGRSQEFERLVQSYRAAGSGRPGLLLLSGEPGIGKTRLAGELLAWASERQAPVLRGRATEIGGAAFGVLAEALGRAVTLLRPRLSPAHLLDLARLIPDLAEPVQNASEADALLTGGSVGPPNRSSDRPDQRVWLLGALSAAVLALSRGPEPLVFLIDDLQWADSGTLSALRHLAAQMGETSATVLLLCTVRSEYLALDSPLSAWLARVRRELPLTTLQVTPLGEDATRHLARAITGLPRPIADQLAAWLYRTTSGHPLYATETLKHLLESGALPTPAQSGQHQPGQYQSDQHPAGRPLDLSGLPSTTDGVRAAIGERLARLDPAALALAQGAAVLGQEAPFAVLQKVAGLDEDAALTGYEQLLRTGLLLERQAPTGRGGPEATAALSHDRVRETLQDALSLPRRQVLHRRALHTLEARGAPAATLADHAHEAGLDLQAAELYERAGLTARELGAYEEALVALERALGLTPATPDFHDARFRLLTEITAALFRRDGGLSGAVLERSWQAAKSAAGRPGEQAAALNLLAGDLIHAGRLDEAEPHALAALGAAETARHPRETARALFRLVKLETDRWHWEAAEHYGQQALNLVADLGEEHEDIALHVELALAAVHRCHHGDLHRARAQVAALLPRAYSFEQRRATLVPHPDNVVARVLWELTWYDFLTGAASSALHHVRQLELTEARPLEMVLAMRALIRLRQDDLPGALLDSASAMDINDRLHIRLPNVHGVRALCLLRGGQLESARTALAAGQAANSSYNHLKDHTDSALRFGEVLLGLGDLEGAQREYLRALRATFMPHVLAGLLGLAQVRTRQGDYRWAALCLGAVLDHGALSLDELQRAQMTLGELRRMWPAEQLHSALQRGQSLPLRTIMTEVRHQLSPAEDAPQTGPDLPAPPGPTP